MKHIAYLFLFFFLALLWPAWSSEPDTPDKSTFLVIYRPGPNWLEGTPVTAQPLKEHGKYMLSLFEKGTLKFAGPFTDDAGGAVVLEVAADAEAQSIAAEDPAVKTGIFLYEIHPWRLVPWEKYVGRQS